VDRVVVTPRTVGSGLLYRPAMELRARRGTLAPEP
jgi:hypothetical protein